MWTPSLQDTASKATTGTSATMHPFYHDTRILLAGVFRTHMPPGGGRCLHPRPDQAMRYGLAAHQRFPTPWPVASPGLLSLT